MHEVENDHFCPGCGAPQRHFARYPWYLCKACLDTAADRDGRRYRFENESPSGGFRYAPEGTEDWVSCPGVICLIRNRPVLVHEARFGGIVAEPLPGRPIHLKGIVDIRQGTPRDPAPRNRDGQTGRPGDVPR